MDWDAFKIVALISAIVTILDKAVTYAKPAYAFFKSPLNVLYHSYSHKVNN